MPAAVGVVSSAIGDVLLAADLLPISRNKPAVALGGSLKLCGTSFFGQELTCHRQAVLALACSHAEPAALTFRLEQLPRAAPPVRAEEFTTGLPDTGAWFPQDLRLPGFWLLSPKYIQDSHGLRRSGMGCGWSSWSHGHWHVMRLSSTSPVVLAQVDTTFVVNQSFHHHGSGGHGLAGR